MKRMQEFLVKAEKEGRADKPMMIKEVDGQMVMEEIPKEVLDSFEFPNGMMGDTIEKDEI